MAPWSFTSTGRTSGLSSPRSCKSSTQKTAQLAREEVQQKLTLSRPQVQQSNSRTYSSPSISLSGARTGCKVLSFTPCTKTRRNLPEEIVAELFTTGFLADAVSALFVGWLADRFGRKNACLAFYAATSLGCLSVLSNNTAVLFAGRALGGLGTTLMYTVFEAWMVTEYNQRALERISLKLSRIFGRMITLSSVVAVLAGIVGQVFVSWTKTNCAPFIASICCLVPASFIIATKWVSVRTITLCSIFN